MSTFRSDYLQRMIEEVARAIAAAMGLRKKREFEEAHRLLENACSDSLGMDLRVLSMMDVASVVSLLGQPQRLEVLARLTREEALLAEAEGREGEAARLCARADELEAHIGGR